MRVATETHISPKEVFETWGLPMLLVTYVYIHNSSVTEFGVQQEYSKNKKPPVVHYENNYIRNITADMIAEGLVTEKDTEFSPEHEALLALYERTI